MNTERPLVCPACRKKNTNPAKLDGSNVGDAVVVTLFDGSSQSAVIAAVTPAMARFVWKTGPNPTDIGRTAIARPEWGSRVKFFGNSTFLAL